jgi:hypothetical protein
MRPSGDAQSTCHGIMRIAYVHRAERLTRAISKITDVRRLNLIVKPLAEGMARLPG